MAAFGISALVIQSAFCAIFYTAELDLTKAAKTNSSSIYNYYVGVALMMLVGFGYLMTFLKANGLGAVGFTMLVTCLGVEWAVILESYVGPGHLSIDFTSLLNGCFAVAAVLISFGGLIGKISPSQTLILVMVELPIYVLNKVYVLGQYRDDPMISDCGGTIIIHVFGAYFGLAACQNLGPPRSTVLNTSSYHSDLFSLIGTVFLWLYWPSFVAGGLPPGEGQTRALLNTVIALLASTVVTFGLTCIMERGRLSTVPIQNATLAGGVAIGAAANLVGPFEAIVVGGVAGIVSTVGFITSPFFGDVDTCGIHNLHGMPGLLGGVFSAIVPYLYPNTYVQPGKQLIGLAATLAISLVSGWLCGFIMKFMAGQPGQPYQELGVSTRIAKRETIDDVNPSDCFNDESHWNCADDIPSRNKKQLFGTLDNTLIQASPSSLFGVVVLFIQSGITAGFYFASMDLSAAAETDISSIYNYYVGVALMMFVGFGYLMTFLKAYGLGAVGFTMFITCLGVEISMLVESFMAKGEFVIDFMALLNGNFAVAAVLISFGGLIGKISPLQILALVLFELGAYTANKVYVLKQYDADPLVADCGGTIIIHVFGAYFGLAACYVLGPPKRDTLNASCYVSDLFSLIGTVFLWLYWPSFVAGALPSGEQQTTALLNTVIALLASTVVTFGLTCILEGGRLSTVPIQNATLAGGVAIGAAANLVSPFVAIVVGGLAGIVSTIGFVRSPFFGDVDTCGIHNLHGMPGLLGGVVSIFVQIFAGAGPMVGHQALGLILTFFVAVVSGAGCGLLLKILDGCGGLGSFHTNLHPNDAMLELFSDKTYWACAEEVPGLILPRPRRYSSGGLPSPHNKQNLSNLFCCGTRPWFRPDVQRGLQVDRPSSLEWVRSPTSTGRDGSMEDAEMYIPEPSIAFGVTLLVVQLVITLLFYGAKLELKQADSTDATSVYNYYVGVALMMFVGFGYLMTFLKSYGLGAVGFTMLITCLGVEWAIVVESYMGKGNLDIDFMSLLNGNFAVAAVLISFGGLIGKVSPLQILGLVLLEILAYCVNKVYLLKQYNDHPLILDCGGTIIIHVFGAYFGIAACCVLGPPKRDGLNGSTYISDLFSLIGTVFLWLYWPSFVAGALPPGPAQTTALLNTVLALLASVVTSFGLTSLLEGGKLSTVPIQNATLAGGVAIGATANLVGPFFATVVGAVAGILSTAGFVYSPFFSSVDTCGIHNLHGMPGLLGACVSLAVPYVYPSTGINASDQLYGLFDTMSVAIIGGLLTGAVLKMADVSNPVLLSYSLPGVVAPQDVGVFMVPEFFSDECYWQCAEDVPRDDRGQPLQPNVAANALVEAVQRANSRPPGMLPMAGGMKAAFPMSPTRKDLGVYGAVPQVSRLGDHVDDMTYSMASSTGYPGSGGFAASPFRDPYKDWLCSSQGGQAAMVAAEQQFMCRTCGVLVLFLLAFGAIWTVYGTGFGSSSPATVAADLPVEKIHSAVAHRVFNCADLASVPAQKSVQEYAQLQERKRWCCENQGVCLTTSTPAPPPPPPPPPPAAVPGSAALSNCQADNLDALTLRDCCAKYGATMPGCLASPPGVADAASAPAASPPLPEDTAQSVGEVAPLTEEAESCEETADWKTSWTVAKQEWCCSHRQVGCVTPSSKPFDCDTGFSNWETLWSKAQQAWCCAQTMRACPATTSAPFDCDVGFSDWGNLWSVAKQHWCCVHMQRSCPVVATTSEAMMRQPAPVAAALPQTPPPQVQAIMSQQAAVAPAVPQTPPPQAPMQQSFDCNIGSDDWHHAWSAEQQRWCCDHAGRGCQPRTAQPFDCQDGLEDWETLWQDAKKDWCCLHKHLGCLSFATTRPPITSSQAPKYDCISGFHNWQYLWSPLQQDWCCNSVNRACH